MLFIAKTININMYLINNIPPILSGAINTFMYGISHYAFLPKVFLVILRIKVSWLK